MIHHAKLLRSHAALSDSLILLPHPETWCRLLQLAVKAVSTDMQHLNQPNKFLQHSFQWNKENAKSQFVRLLEVD